MLFNNTFISWLTNELTRHGIFLPKKACNSNFCNFRFVQNFRSPLNQRGLKFLLILFLFYLKPHEKPCLTFLKRPFSIYMQCASGTALHEAVLFGKVDVVNLLLQCGELTKTNFIGNVLLTLLKQLPIIGLSWLPPF